MMGMPLHIGWGDVALRLVLTIIAGALIGYNRTEHGKAAGLRTTLFVCLAASVAMIQMNLLLPMAGKPSDSFITNDLMRLPLGILTGVGFIGGGAILRRDNIISGVTTAATLWYVTVIGLHARRRRHRHRPRRPLGAGAAGSSPAPRPSRHAVPRARRRRPDRRRDSAPIGGCRLAHRRNAQRGVKLRNASGIHLRAAPISPALRDRAAGSMRDAGEAGGCDAARIERD